MTVAPPQGAGPLLVLAGAVLWGTTGTAQALGAGGVAGGIPPPVVGAARIAVGGVGLLAVAAVTGALPGLAQLRRPSVAPALAAGALAIAAYQATFFAGVARAGVALGTLVAIGSAPVLTGAVGWAARGERPEPAWVPATALAVLGAVLLLVPRGGVGADPLGVLLALGAGLCFAVGTVSMKTALEAGIEPAGVVALLFGSAAVLLLPVLLAADLAWVSSPAGWGMALYLGLAATTLAYVLFSRGLRWVPSSSAATLALAEPLTATLLGVALLAERPGPLGWAGGGLLVGGLLVLTRRPRRL